MMTIQEHDTVVLTEDLPSSGLKAEDVGVVVHVYPGGKAYEVEFLALDGDVIAVETLEADQVRAIRPREIPHARVVAGA
jgi:hypothetical protein